MDLQSLKLKLALAQANKAKLEAQAPESNTGFLEKLKGAAEYLPSDWGRQALLGAIARPGAAVKESLAEAMRKAATGEGSPAMGGLKGLLTGESTPTTEILQTGGLPTPTSKLGTVATELAGGLVTDPFVWAGGILTGMNARKLANIQKALRVANKELPIESAASDATFDLAESESKLLGLWSGKTLEVPEYDILRQLTGKRPRSVKALHSRIVKQMEARLKMQEANEKLAKLKYEQTAVDDQAVSGVQTPMLIKEAQELGLSDIPDLTGKPGEIERFLSKMRQREVIPAESAEAATEAIMTGTEIPSLRSLHKISLSTGKPTYGKSWTSTKGQNIAARLVSKEFEAMGFSPGAASGRLSSTYDLASSTFNAAEIQRRTGVTVADLPRQGYQNAIDRHNSFSPIVERTGNLFKQVDKTEISDVRFIELATGKAPRTPEEAAIVEQLRPILDETREVAIRISGRDIGYLDNYFPGRLKAAIKGVTRLKTKKTVATPGKTPMELPKTKKGIFPELAETNPRKILMGYIREADRMATYPIIEGYINKARQLKTLGYDSFAQEMLDNVIHATGYAKPAAKNIIGSVLVKDSGIDAAKLTEMLEIIDKLPTTKVEKFIDTLNNFMYESFVGLNPRVHIQQKLQNIVLGVPEIGREWVNRGNKLYREMSDLEKELIHNQVATKEGPNVMEAVRGITQPVQEGKLATGLHWLGRWGLKQFGKTDIHNRARIYLGAKAQIMDGMTRSKVDDVLEGLADYEKDLVRRKWAERGIDEAADLYAKIRVDRVHFRYSPYETPKALRGTIGRLIPFTSWTRNNWERYLQDVRQGDINQLARRVAVPLIYGQAIAAVTGVDIPGLSTVGSLTGIGGVRPFPYLSDITERGRRGQYKGALKSAAGLLPPLNILLRGKKLIEQGPIKAAGMETSGMPSIAGYATERLGGTKLEDIFKQSKKKKGGK